MVGSTVGVPLRFCASGGCRYGEPGREDLGPPFEAWYIGSDGVETLDMLAYPRDNCCAAVEGGLSGATRNYWQFLFVFCIDAAKETNAMNTQGYHKKEACKCAGKGVVLRFKGPLGRRSQCSKRQSTTPCSRGQAAMIWRPRHKFTGFTLPSHSTKKLCKAVSSGELLAVCLRSILRGMQSCTASRRIHSIKPWQALNMVIHASSDGALLICIRDVMRLMAW